MNCLTSLLSWVRCSLKQKSKCSENNQIPCENHKALMHGLESKIIKYKHFNNKFHYKSMPKTSISNQCKKKKKREKKCLFKPNKTTNYKTNNNTVEPPWMVTSQQQPPPYNSHFLSFPKYIFTINLTSP